jgi:hypothetical protein
MKVKLILCALGLCISLIRAMSGQVASSTTLVGAVTDDSGAVIPNARILAVQDAAKVPYKGVTSGTGDYVLPYVAVGTYTITVEADGFEKQKHTNILIEVNHTVRTDFTLKIGAATNEVTVTSAEPAIATDDASLVQTLSTQAIASQPVVGDDALKLALTTAGVQQSGDVTVGDPPGESFAGPGVRGEQEDVSLDGVTLMNSIHVTVDFPPSPDALQEFSVQTATYSTQYGGNLGIHVNAVSKAGGNDFHGVLTEANQNGYFAAHGRFDKQGSAKHPLNQDRFGGEVDGPVILPWLYNGRKKTFFMFDYQGRRQIAKTAGIYTIVTGPERTGDFSALLTAPKPMTLSDPVDPTCIVGNVMQPRCIDPLALEVLNFMPPLPNLDHRERSIHRADRDGSKVPLLSGRTEKRVAQREISYSERNSLVDDLCETSPGPGIL